MSLDRPKAMTFDCSSCSAASQRLRNCADRFPKSDAMNILDGATGKTIYKQCPKGIWLEARSERDLLRLYIECRESKVWPDSGSVLDQTAFTVELFNYLDGLMADWRARKQAEQEEKAAALRKGK